MARQTVKTTTTKTYRRKKSDVDTHPCPTCGGTGRKKNVGAWARNHKR